MSICAKIYMDAQRSSGLKVGDWVKIMDADLSDNCGWEGTWNYRKQATIGKTGRIVSMTDRNITVSGRELGRVFEYPYFVLQKVKKPEHKFKSFDKVLVRDFHTKWVPHIFRSYNPTGAPYETIDGNIFDYCIPYEGNEHLAGTADDPE